MFQTADELDGFMEHAVASGFSRKVMIGVLTTSCFGWQNTALGLCVSSLRMNHLEVGWQKTPKLKLMSTSVAALPNARATIADGQYRLTATRDLQAGDMVRTDSRDFGLPGFYLDFCVKHNIALHMGQNANFNLVKDSWVSGPTQPNAFLMNETQD